MARLSRFYFVNRCLAGLAPLAAGMFLVACVGCADDGASTSGEGPDAAFADSIDDTEGGDAGDTHWGPGEAGAGDDAEDGAINRGDSAHFDSTSDATSDGEPDAGPREVLALGIEEGCNPLASTSECLFPHPSRFFQLTDATAPSGYRVALRNDAVALPPGAPPLDFEAFNDADGHSPSAPLIVHLGADIAAQHLVDLDSTASSLLLGAPIAVMRRDTGERVPLLTEMDQTFRDGNHEGRHALIIRPMVPFEMGARYVAVLTSQLTDPTGEPLASPKGFEALRDAIATDHAALEASRQDYEEIFTFLADHGYERGDILLAFDFQVASREWVIGGALSMREQALAEYAENGPAYNITKLVKDPNENVLFLVEGTFEVPRFIDESNRLIRRPDGTVQLQPTRATSPFTLLVPKRAAQGEPLPLVLFGHGIFGTGNDYLAGGIGVNYIQPLAEEIGGVVVATNFIGLSGADAELIASSIVQNLDNIYVITDRLQQSLINNIILVHTVRDAIQWDAKLAPARGPLLTEDNLYYGVSLGGIQGVALAALSGLLSRTVAAVPGGAWSTMLPRSIVYSPFKAIVDSVYPDPLLHQLFFSLIQSRFDGSDGINLGMLLYREPPAWAAAERKVLLQEAIGDCQVPNIVTRMVARAIGLAQLTPEVETAWGLTTTTSPTATPCLAQFLMPERLEDYTPPKDNTIPLFDNGTHSDAIVLPSAFAQVKSFLATGIVEQPCDGPCDPD